MNSNETNENRNIITIYMEICQKLIEYGHTYQQMDNIVIQQKLVHKLKKENNDLKLQIGELSHFIDYCHNTIESNQTSSYIE